MKLKWDRTKDRSNQAKHGLCFDEARSLLEGDDDYLVIYDAHHSQTEDRFVAVGPTTRGVIVVIYAEEAEEVARIISARMATRRECALFRTYVRGARR